MFLELYKYYTYHTNTSVTDDSNVILTLYPPYFYQCDTDVSNVILTLYPPYFYQRDTDSNGILTTLIPV